MANARGKFESSDSSMESENEQEERTVKDLIKSISDDEVPKLLKSKEKLKNFSENLLKCKKSSNRDREISHLREVIEQVAERSQHLQHLLDNFLTQRRDLLEILKAHADKMDIITKLCNTGKLISSFIDSAGVIGSSVIKQSNSAYINLVLDFANAAGLIGFASSAAELIVWKTILEDLVREIQKDQDNFNPIQEFFQQNNELEQAVQAIFPLNLTARILMEFENTIQEELSRSELLQTVLVAVLREDQQHIRNASLIQNLIDFISCPATRFWCRWIFLRHHKVTLDVARMLLQLNSPQKLVSSQNVGNIARFSTNSRAVAVLGRVGLNCMNMYDAVCTLRNGGMVEEMRKLERHLQDEMETLIQIVSQLRRKRPSYVQSVSVP